MKQSKEPTRSQPTAQEITASRLHDPMQNNALHNGGYPPPRLDAATGTHTATHQKLRTKSIKNTDTGRAKLPTSFNRDFALFSDSNEGVFEMDLPEQRESSKDVFDRKKLPSSFLEDIRKSRKKWPQSAGKEDINSDALSSTASSSTAGDVLDVETARRVLSEIRKVMEDPKTDPSQILPADEAAARLHTIFDLVFSSKRSCKTLLKIQGDDAKIVLNSLQWVSRFSSSNLCSR